MTEGNWKLGAFVDAASDEQADSVVKVFTGELGGPMAGLAPLIGEVLGVYDTEIDFQMIEGKGTIRMGEAVYGEMQPYADAQGRPTKLVDTIFSTIPGSPAYMGKASVHRVNMPEHDMRWEFSGRNAVLGEFKFEA
jgi:hypothetical protein